MLLFDVRVAVDSMVSANVPSKLLVYSTIKPSSATDMLLLLAMDMLIGICGGLLDLLLLLKMLLAFS